MVIESADQHDLIKQVYRFSCYITHNQILHKKLGIMHQVFKLLEKRLFIKGLRRC
jgi:hypothetical protein